MRNEGLLRSDAWGEEWAGGAQPDSSLTAQGTSTEPKGKNLGRNGISSALRTKEQSAAPRELGKLPSQNQYGRKRKVRKQVEAIG